MNFTCAKIILLLVPKLNRKSIFLTLPTKKISDRETRSDKKHDEKANRAAFFFLYSVSVPTRSARPLLDRHSIRTQLHITPDGKNPVSLQRRQ